jgi:uncharacterized protein (DUF1778 family)
MTIAQKGGIVMSLERRIDFRVSEEEHRLIEEAARKDERNMSDFVRLTLLRAIRGKGKPKKR